MQGIPGAVSAAQSTGVFLGAPYNSLDASATQSAQLYAQQLQQQGRAFVSDHLTFAYLLLQYHKLHDLYDIQKAVTFSTWYRPFSQSID